MVMLLEAESNEQGRLTIPAQAREVLRVSGKTHWQVEVTDEGLLLRPAVLIPREDAWAYTPEHLALIEQARAEARAEETKQLSPADLLEATQTSRV